MHTPFTFFFFFFNDTATTEIYTLSLHDALPILLVHLYRRRHPGAVGAQHLERHAVEREPVAGARRMPGRSRCLARAQELEVERPAERPARLEHQRGRKRLEHRGHAAQMIGIAVGRDHDRDGRRPRAPQEWHHDASPGVALGGAGTAVDDDPATGGGAQHPAVAPPPREKMYAETTAGVESKDAAEGRKNEDRKDESASSRDEPGTARRMPQPPPPPRPPRPQPPRAPGRDPRGG